MIRALSAKVIGDAKWLFAASVVLMFFFPWVFLWASGKISLPAFSNFPCQRTAARVAAVVGRAVQPGGNARKAALR